MSADPNGPSPSHNADELGRMVDDLVSRFINMEKREREKKRSGGSGSGSGSGSTLPPPISLELQSYYPRPAAVDRTNGALPPPGQTPYHPRPAPNHPQSTHNSSQSAGSWGSSLREFRTNSGNPQSQGPILLKLASLTDLLAEEPEQTAWLVDGLLPSGGISVLAAKPKVGKSTLARNLALAVARGEPFLGRAVAAPGSVLYLALEEKREEVARHFRLMGAAGEPVYIHVGSAPVEALLALEMALLVHKPRLAIVDPMLKLVRLKDANDYAEVSRSLEPLIEMARESGCHILCVHHIVKGDRTGGDAILGSTALFGAVDTALIMKRRENTRTVESVQRYGQDLPELVLSMDPDAGVISVAGEAARMQIEDLAGEIAALLESSALTESEIRDALHHNNVSVGKVLRQMLADGRVSRHGQGNRASPYSYSLPGAHVKIPAQGEESAAQHGPDYLHTLPF